MTRTTKANGPQSRAPRKRGGGAKNLTVKKLSICFTNIRGLRGNFDSVESFIAENGPDVLALCETNLNPEISSSDFGLGVICLSSVRIPQGTCTGLAVYIRSSLPIVARACDF